MNSQGTHRLKVTGLGKRGREGVENHFSVLPGSGSDRKSQAELSSTHSLPQRLTLALCHPSHVLSP